MATNTVMFESLSIEESLPGPESGFSFDFAHFEECENSMSIESTFFSDLSYQESVDTDTSGVKKLVEMINGFLAGDNTEDFNEESLIPLRKIRENIKQMDLRKQLDEILFKIDTNLEKISEMDTDSYEINEEKNQIALRTEYQICFKELTKTRDLIQSCIKRHTELYLMGQQCDELISNTQLLKINIPDLNLSQFGKPIANLIKKLMTEVIKGIERFSWLKGLGNKLVTTCEFFSNKRNIRAFCRNLKKSGIERTLNKKLEELGNIRKAMRGELRRDTDTMNLSSFNIIMKAYKDYRITYEESRADPEKRNESDEEFIS